MSLSPTPAASLEVISNVIYCNQKEGFARLMCGDWFIPLAGMLFAIVWMFFILNCLGSLVRRYVSSDRTYPVLGRILNCNFVNSLFVLSGLEPQIAQKKADSFQSKKTVEGHVYGQNWSYDYVLAFRVEDAGASTGHSRHVLFFRCLPDVLPYKIALWLRRSSTKQEKK